MNDRGKIKVLIVDDSAIVRKLLAQALSQEPDLEVVGTAPDPYVARDKILSLEPDVITLDLEMPRMDGLTFLRKLMQFRPMPVIVISSLGQSGCKAALDALQAGAVEVLGKPGGPYSVGELQLHLPGKIRAAAAARVRVRESKPAPPMAASAPSTLSNSCLERVVAIGASTGGTEAILVVLQQFPKDCPPILIAQHIPAGFSRAFADRLNQICAMEVKEAVDGDWVGPGRALVAPGNFHMLLQRGGGGFVASVKTGPAVCYQRPSVDVMFRSVAQVAGSKAIGVILTGMGADGAEGMLEMHHAGAYNIAQDEASCVVFGMPREAIRLGGVDRVLPLSRVGAGIAAAMPAIKR
ncbi:MAG: chemotaxis response regulator protein-glutamate methylesterase [Bryobacteraceae bacterium]